VRVLGARVRNTVLEYDRGGFVNPKLGAFNEAGKVSLKKGQRRAVARCGGARVWWRTVQFSAQRFEQLEASGIERQTLAAREACRSGRWSVCVLISAPIILLSAANSFCWPIFVARRRASSRRRFTSSSPKRRNSFSI
jgi:hypothetical protein